MQRMLYKSMYIDFLRGRSVSALCTGTSALFSKDTYVQSLVGAVTAIFDCGC